MKALAIVAGIFGLVGLTVSLAGGLVALVGAALLWFSAAKQPAQSPFSRKAAIATGVLLAFLVGPFVSSTTRSSEEESSPAAVEGKHQVEQRDTARQKRDEEMTEIKLQRLARGFVAGTLKDPASAQFRNQHGACGEVNAKNSFGGYGGYTRFIAAGENLVFMENDPNLARGAFQESWERFCR